MAEFYSIKWFKEVDSTNATLAAERDTAADRTVHAAEYQSAGRGQRGNLWHSRSGENLTFSVLLRPAALPALRQFSLSQAAALGVASYLDSLGIDSKVKWPNDIYVGNRKICGMLLENSLVGNCVSTCVAGIGLNINQTDFGPALPNATSVALQLGRNLDIHAELPALLNHIDKYLSQIDKGEFDALNAAYTARLFGLGEWRSFLDRRSASTLIPTTDNVPGTEFRARITGITKNGELLLEFPDSSIQSFSFKEVTYIL